MYSRVSPLDLVWLMLCALTLGFLLITAQLFQDWRIETAGVWSKGTIVGINHCYNRSVRLATVHLDVQFTDHHGASRVSQTDCEYDRYNVGQSISVRYLPENPDRILIPADIHGGQPLILLLKLDAICVPLSVLATVYAVRRMRRQKAERAEAQRQGAERIAALRAGKGKRAAQPHPAPRRRTRKSLR